MSLNSTFAKSIFNTERFQTDNNLLKDGQTATSTDKSKTDGKNPIIGKATVSLENKPPEMPLGEHLKRQALNKIAADYGLRSEDVELEIQYIKEKSGGNFINDLSFGETQVKNPNDLTDLQVADLIKNGHKTVEFGIHQATIERMVKRDELVKWLAQKDEFGINISISDRGCRTWRKSRLHDRLIWRKFVMPNICSIGGCGKKHWRMSPKLPKQKLCRLSTTNCEQKMVPER